jgi:mRNA-degrading endonuclease toxin of MazEF toxin-antitoxin module
VSTPTPSQRPQRGDIYWASFPRGKSVGSEQWKDRPVLVMSETFVNQRLPVCMVVPLSEQVQKANRWFRIMIPDSEKIQDAGTRGCQGDSLALCEQLRCIDQSRLIGPRLAVAKPAAIAAVETGIKYILRLP